MDEILDEEHDDEETESDAEVRRTASNAENVEAITSAVQVEDTPRSSTDEPLRLAAEIGAAVVSELDTLNPDAAT